MSTKHSTQLSAYIVGFALSVALTLAAYLIVVEKLIYGNTAVGILLFLAVLQLYVQLRFFLHMGRETKPRWNLIMFILAVWFALALSIGTIWIMDNLHYMMMPNSDPSQTEEYIFEREHISPDSDNNQPDSNHHMHSEDMMHDEMDMNEQMQSSDMYNDAVDAEDPIMRPEGMENMAQ